MSDNHHSAFSSGFALLWRRQRVLWWIFAVNVACGLFGALPGFMGVRRAIGHSLAADELTRRFDIGMFVELLRAPDAHIWRYSATSFIFAFVFFVFLLFVTGGVLETYREDRRLATGEFFAASGAYFWPFVRLLLLSIVPFVIVGIIYGSLDKIADRLGERAIADEAGIFLSWGAIAVFLLLALVVRLWFDVAQVRTVVHGEHRMWRNLWRAWRITWQGLGRLYAMYFAISLLAWITTGVSLWIWTMLPATATGAVFLVLELIVFAQIAARLWQLAAATTWYKRHPEMLPGGDFSIPIAQQIVQTEPAPTLEDIVVEKISAHGEFPNSAGTSPANEPAADAGGETSPPRDPGPDLPPPTHDSHLK